ncbi:MAG: M23 family metallopeptidase [Bacteroidota bacterium]
MAKKKEKKENWISRLRNKYRLVVMNDSTFEEKLSFRLSRLNVFIVLGTTAIILVFLTTYIIAFTPLREYIPGYARVDLQKQLYDLQMKSDSMQQTFRANDLYLKNITSIMNGGTPAEMNAPNLIEDNSTKKDFKNVSLDKSALETKLRNEVENMSKEYLAVLKTDISSSQTSSLKNFFFFTPVKGVLTNLFNISEKHFGVDIVAQKGESIKAVLDGTVIFSQWTLENGWIIALQHTQNVISIYKHNSTLLKKEGSIVKAGEPIAIIGNSGENTTGTHLHFELWFNGVPVNPKEYISF